MALKTYGPMAVDWENRIDFDRLRRERLARAKALLGKSEMGALLCFDMNNVRYITATHIGTWAQDKISRFTLLPQNDEPILWEFRCCAEGCRRKGVARKMWRGKSKWNWRSAGCTKSRWESTSSSRRFCLHLRRRASRLSMGSR